MFMLKCQKYKDHVANLVRLASMNLCSRLTPIPVLRQLDRHSLAISGSQPIHPRDFNPSNPAHPHHQQQSQSPTSRHQAPRKWTLTSNSVETFTRPGQRLWRQRAMRRQRRGNNLAASPVAVTVPKTDIIASSPRTWSSALTAI